MRVFANEQNSAGSSARIWLSRLDVAVRGCGGRGLLCKFKLRARARIAVYRGCAAEHGPSHRQAKRRLKQGSIASTIVEEACRQICLVERQRGTESVETRRVFVLGRVVSCRSADLWWRTKLDLGSGEPFDDLHRSATPGTAIKICSVFVRGGVFFGK
jgi:hypothetical protein